MRRRVSSIIIAVAMVFSTAAVSFATTGTSSPAEKVRLDVTSGETTISVVATEDYVVTAEIDGDSVDQAAVTATLIMKDVAALGIEGTKTGSFTLETGLEGDGDISLRGNMSGIAVFRSATINASVNGYGFVYNIAKSEDSNGTNYDKWIATPEEPADVSAAWQELTSYVETATGEADSGAVIEAGTIIQIGKEAIIFDETLDVNNLNVKGDDYTQKVFDAVRYDGDYGKTGEYKVFLPAGSYLQVGASMAELQEGAWVEMTGIDLTNLEDTNPLATVKEYAEDRDYAGMLQTFVPMMGSILAAADGEEINVAITIEEEQEEPETTIPEEKVRLEVESGGTVISVVATEDYVVTAEIDGDSVDQAAVTAVLTMKDIANLEIEGTRQESFTLETGLEGDGDISLRGNMSGLAAFESAKVEGSVNGLEFIYNIAKDKETSNGIDYDKWVATPEGENADAVRAAWVELASLVETATGEEDDSFGYLPKGTVVQFGKEAIIFEEGLDIDNLNAKGDNYTQKVLDAVKYDGDYGKPGVYQIYLPAESALGVGSSQAILNGGVRIVIGGTMDLLKIEETKPFAAVKEYAADRDYAGMLQTFVSMMGSILAEANGETITVDITSVYLCDRCGAELIEGECDRCDTVYRVSGLTRYSTALKTADALKDELGVEKFDAVVVATGEKFADALSGSYLAEQNNAPILLIKGGTIDNSVVKYINNNMKEDGTVYVLGGTKAVKDSWLKGLKVKPVRLAGADRYETNLKILEAAKVEAGAEIAVCTGTNFADSLSVSAANKPILLVEKKVTAAQTNYLKNTVKDETYCIVGGTSAVSKAVENSLKNRGKVVRLAGADRYKTSVMVAERYFEAPKYAVVARGDDFADGLAGGPLAWSIDGPVVLTKNGSTNVAKKYLAKEGINAGYVVGGTVAIKNSTAKTVFGIDYNPIKY